MSELTLHVAPGGALMSDYEIASAALARAVSVDEVKRVNDAGERLKFEARKAGDTELLDNAIKLVLRAQRRLGEMLIDGREAGLIADGRPKKGDDRRIRLADLGIDLRLSMKAQKLARFDARDFNAMLDAGSQKIRAGKAVVINPLRDLSKKDKALRRAIKLAQLAARQKDLPQARFGVILADPEWPDEDVWSEAGLDRAPDNHYPTSSVADIAARRVADIAADDAVLGLWIPMRHLARGTHVKVLESWGFSPRAVLIWDKVEAGTGYWVRNRVEALIIAVRGNVPAPTPGTQWEDIVAAPSTVHSAKPDWQYAWFEQFFPNLKKIELNARRRRPGWEAWGYEAPEDEPLPHAPAEEADRFGDDSISPRSGQEADRFGDSNWSEESTSPAGVQTEPHPVEPRPVSVAAEGPEDEPPAAGEAAPSSPAASSSTGARKDVPGKTTVRDDALAQIGDDPVKAAQPPADEAVFASTGGSARKRVPEGNPAGTQAPPVETLTDDEKNALIERAYKAETFPGLEAIVAATGLNRNTIKQRAKRRGWGSEAHRLDVVSQPGRQAERQAAE